jgi:hypothetical protein
MPEGAYVLIDKVIETTTENKLLVPSDGLKDVGYRKKGYHDCDLSHGMTSSSPADVHAPILYSCRLQHK